MAKPSDQLIKEIERFMAQTARESKRTEQSWQDVSKHVEKVTKSLDKGFAKQFLDVLGVGPKIKDFGTGLSMAFSQNRVHMGVLAKEAAALHKKWRLETDLAAKKGFEDAYNAKRKLLLAEKALFHEIGDIIKSKWTYAAMAFVGQIAIAARYSREMQDVLKQANSDYAVRSRLMSEIAQVQAATGNELSDMGKGAAALVDYGYDLRGNFKDTLTTIVKMEEGLGVSYGLSAQMAVAVRRINGDFKGVADSVARIKADTALSAEEATKFATQISKAVMMLRPGSGGLIAQTSDYISRMAAALKELTGSGDAFVTMMTEFGTEKGMMGAATLGATPDFLSDPAQAKKVTERFVNYVNQQLAGTSGYQRMATIQLLQDQFNTSADVIVNANEMLKKYNETQQKGTSLNEQWRQQTAEFQKTMSKIGNSLAAIVQQTLVPVIRWLNPLLEKLAAGIQWVASSGAALYLGIGALALSAAGALITVNRLTMALWRFAGATGVIGNLTGAGGAAGGAAAGGLRAAVMTWLPRIGTALRGLLGPIGLVAAAAVGGWEAGKLIAKHTGIGNRVMEGWLERLTKKEDTWRAQQLAYTSGGMTRQDILQQVSAMAMSGKSAEEIQKFILKSASSMKGLHGDALTKERREKILTAFLQDAGIEITRQRVRMGYARQLTESTAEDRAKDAQMIELYKAIANNTALQNELLKRAEAKHDNIEEVKRRDREEMQGEQRLIRQSIDSQSRVNNIPSGVFFMPTHGK